MLTEMWWRIPQTQNAVPFHAVHHLPEVIMVSISGWRANHFTSQCYYFVLMKAPSPSLLRLLQPNDFLDVGENKLTAHFS
jgi:hypothetical protein